jgi:hypothetical protein
VPAVDLAARAEEYAFEGWGTFGERDDVQCPLQVGASGAQRVEGDRPDAGYGGQVDDVRPVGWQTGNGGGVGDVSSNEVYGLPTRDPDRWSGLSVEIVDHAHMIVRSQEWDQVPTDEARPADEKDAFAR